MRALLVLYIVNQLDWSQKSAYATLGAYASLVYLSNIIGGYAADKLFGFRRAILLGGIVITIGHFCLAFENLYCFYAGLGLVVAGTGLFKANITSFLGDFYHKDDPRRDPGYTIFYLGINLGGLLAFLGCGYVADRFGWHAAFSLAGFGMLLGLLIFIFGRKYLEDKGYPEHPERLSSGLGKLAHLMPFVLAAGFAYLVYETELSEYFLHAIGAIAILYALYIAFTSSSENRKHIFTLLFMMIFLVLFLGFWEQQASSINILVDQYVNRGTSLLERFNLSEVPTLWFGAMNPVSVLIFGSLIAYIWEWLGEHHKAPFAPMKFVIGFAFLAAAFGSLSYGVENLGSPDAKLHMGWIALFYVIYTIGELCVMPVGFSLVTKLTPHDTRGFFMGLWMVGIAYAEQVAAKLAQLTSLDEGIESGKESSIQAFGDFFSQSALWILYAAMTLLVASFILRPIFRKVEG